MSDFTLYGKLNQLGDPVAINISGTFPQFTGDVQINGLDCAIAGTLEQFSGEIETAQGTFYNVRGDLPQFGGSVSIRQGTAFALSGTFKQFTGSAVMTTQRQFAVSGKLKQFTGSITTFAKSDFAVSGVLGQFGGRIEFAGSMVAVCMNAYNRAITEYTNYNFNSLIAHSDGKYYAIGPDGIYLLEGDDDDGTAIAGTFRTGRGNLGTSLKKNVPDAYISCAGESLLRTITDSDKLSGALAVGRANYGVRRVRLPLGRLSTLWGVEISSTDPDFTVDTIELLPEPSTRRVNGD